MILGQQEPARIEGMRGLLVREESQFAHVGREEVVGVGVTAHLGGVHETRVGQHERRPRQGLQGQQHAIVPVHIREKVMEGQSTRREAGGVVAQPGVEAAAAVARADVPGQQGAGGLRAEGLAGQQGGGGQRWGAAFHRHAASVGQAKGRAVQPQGTVGRGQRKIRVRYAARYAPHASCLRASSKAFCRL